MGPKAYLSLLLLLTVAIACAAPIRLPISALHTRRDPGPDAAAESLDSLLPSPLDLPLPKPEPLDVDSMLAHSPLSDFYKIIKEEVKGLNTRPVGKGYVTAGLPFAEAAFS